MDRTAGFHEEHARNRELVVFLPRCGFEVDAVLQIHLDVVIAELKRDSECARGCEGAIRIERISEIVRLSTFLEFGGLVWTDRDDRESQRLQLVFDLAQLAELRIAVGSPAAAVEDEQRTGLAEEFGKVDGRSIHRADAHRRYGRARLQRLGRLCARVYRVRCGCHARDQQQAGRPGGACARSGNSDSVHSA